VHTDSGDSPAATLTSPNIRPREKNPDPAPEKPVEESPSPARFQSISVYESEGLASSAPGRLSYSQVLRSKAWAWVNIEGRALVVLDESAEARLAYAADAGAYVVEVARGRLFIDTAGGEQSWEFRRDDRTVTLRAFRGRASVETDKGSLVVKILRGAAEVGPHRLEAGLAVEVEPNSSVTLGDRLESCASLAERFAFIRPRTLLVLRAAAGTSSNDGPWRYVSPSRKAEPLKDAGAVIPECADPIRWVVIALDEPLNFASDMVLRAACGGTGTKIYLWAGGQGGWHREATRAVPGTSPEEWSLRGLRREMVDLVAGEELRKFMIGVVQERGRENTLRLTASKPALPRLTSRGGVRENEGSHGCLGLTPGDRRGRAGSSRPGSAEAGGDAAIVEFKKNFYQPGSTRGRTGHRGPHARSNRPSQDPGRARSPDDRRPGSRGHEDRRGARARGLRENRWNARGADQGLPEGRRDRGKQARPAPRPDPDHPDAG
jgi:hypothetical protein